MFSVKGIARKYRAITGNFSVKTVFGNPIPSLFSVLEAVAREGHSFSVSECIFGWTASFEQTWTRIIIRIRLNPDAGIPAATIATLQNNWRQGIRNIWNNKWACGGLPTELASRIIFDVQWVNNNPHHTVRVRVGPAGSNMTTWDTADTGNVAAHEFGHMLGLPDEYIDTDCPARNPVNTGTVMDNNSNNVPNRMMQRIANNIGTNVVPI